ncbi:MAG: DUF3820 family protein [Sulfuritalea sp.]|jgi:uncharacterized protein (DUF3820 family)|nr:DUF3820 family protein [Sulfuritalea sp.]
MRPEDLELLVTRVMSFGKQKGRLIADLPGMLSTSCLVRQS